MRAQQKSGMREWSPVAVVTGASSGIGEAVAWQLAEHGYHVILIARREARLHALARQIVASGGKATVIRADLSVERQRLRAYRMVKRLHRTVDVLVNGAGLGWYGYAHRMPWITARNILRVNVECTLHLTLLFLRDMQRRGAGHIITIGSVVGGIPSQGVALYAATKSFLDAFTTALFRESRGSGVHFTVIRPGPVRTEFGQTARRQPRGFAVPTDGVGVGPALVAHAVMSAIRRPRRFVYVLFWLRLVPWLELSAGWLMDMLGPLLLKRQDNPGRSSGAMEGLGP